MIMLICGVLACIMAIGNFTGTDWGVAKSSRELPERKAWQRRKAVLELVEGIAAIIFFIMRKLPIVNVILGVIIIGCIILDTINDQKFAKNIPES